MVCCNNFCIKQIHILAGHPQAVEQRVLRWYQLAVGGWSQTWQHARIQQSVLWSLKLFKVETSWWLKVELPAQGKLSPLFFSDVAGGNCGHTPVNGQEHARTAENCWRSKTSDFICLWHHKLNSDSKALQECYMPFTVIACSGDPGQIHWEMLKSLCIKSVYVEKSVWMACKSCHDVGTQGKNPAEIPLWLICKCLKQVHSFEKLASWMWHFQFCSTGWVTGRLWWPSKCLLMPIVCPRCWGARWKFAQFPYIVFYCQSSTGTCQKLGRICCNAAFPR